MKRFMIAASLVMVIGLASGCTDTTIAHFESIGDPAHVTCFSGGVKVYEGHSTGKVATTSQSDGWEFMDATDRKLVRVSGTCVVKQD